MGRYKTDRADVTVMGGKLACVNKGIAFSKGQLVDAVRTFKKALSGSGFEDSLNIQDTRGDAAGGVNSDFNNDDENDEDYYENEDECEDAPEDDDTDSNLPNTDQIQVLGENISQTNLFVWKFPSEISQSTLNGRNGSSACSIIALIMAHGIWNQHLDLQATPLLCPLWVMLLHAAIRVGNRLYDRCRHSLPQRYLSASEAASIAEQRIALSVDSPLPVRVCDEHAPTTLLYQLQELCKGDRGDAALLIANEKTVLFTPVGNSSIVLVDTHRHGIHGAEVLLGQQNSLDQFVHVSQAVIDLRDDTYANLSFITF